MKTPFEFQETGINFLREGKRVVLADDMGLGKTLQSLHAVELPAIIMGPKGPIVNNWEKEIRDIYPDAKIQYLTDPTFNKRFRKCVPGYDFYLTNYERIRNAADLYIMEKLNCKTVVVDEGHRLRNHSTQLFMAMKKLAKSTERLYFLTGTPLVNKPDELWSYLHLIAPNKYDSYPDFCRVMFKMQNEGWSNKIVGIRNPAMLQELLDKYLLRRMKEDVFDLEKPRILHNLVKLDGVQETIYKQMLMDAYTELTGNYVSATNILAQMIRLKQITVSADLIEMGDSELTGAKVDDVQSIIESTDAKILVFSQFGEVIKRLPKDANTKHWAMFTGKYGNREEAVERFKTDPDCKVLYMTYQAGGEGLNLQEAEYVVLIDLPWTGKDIGQAVSRAHRLGQTKLVTVYSLEAENTIDQYIGKLLLDKINMIEAVISGDTAHMIIKECAQFMGLVA